MDAKAIEVNGKSFVPGFGMKFFRLLSEKFGVDSINAVIARLVVLESIGDEVTFSQIDTITAMILSSIEANPDNKEVITEAEIENLFLQDVTVLTLIVEQIMKGFMASMPQAKAVGKSKAAKK